MPYKNIVFVKLLVELVSDYRYTELLDDNQKLLYLNLLLLAGFTDNRIYNDGKFIKRTLNLKMAPEIIEQGVIHIREVYPKLLEDNGFLLFSNFKDIHNFKIGIPKTALEKRREEKRREDIEKSRREPLSYDNDVCKAIHETAKKLSIKDKNEKTK